MDIENIRSEKVKVSDKGPIKNAIRHAENQLSYWNKELKRLKNELEVRKIK